MANPFDVEVANPLQALLIGQKAYGDAQEARKQQGITDARSKAVQAYQTGDPKSALATLLGVGDVQGANAIGTQIQNDWTRKHTETQDARQAGRDSIADQHWQASFGLQKRAADRADEGPVEQAGYRASVVNKYGLDPNSPEGKSYILTGKLPDSFNNGGQPEVGLNPAYGVGPDGKTGAIQFSKSGKAVQTQLPEGFSLSREPIKVDLGTSIQLIDPITRQPIGNPIAKDIAGAEKAKEVGSAQGQAEVALPQVIANSQSILNTIDQVKNHPGKKYSLGAMSMAPTIPGTPQADFRASLDQLKGQTFLQAYQTLRGGGAITDVEGKKGENALVRMQTAQTQASFDSALDDFKGIVKSGMDRARAKAGGGASAPATPAANDPLGIR